MRDLRVDDQPLDGRLFHDRDSNGLEVDAVIELPGCYVCDNRLMSLTTLLGLLGPASATEIVGAIQGPMTEPG